MHSKLSEVFKMSLKKENDEYELIPLNPIRKLEKRLHKLESRDDLVDVKGVTSNIFEMITTNQALISDVLRSNDKLSDEISKLPPKIDELLEEMSNFIKLLSAASEISDVKKEKPTDFIFNEKFDQLINLNKNMLIAMEKFHPIKLKISKKKSIKKR